MSKPSIVEMAEDLAGLDIVQDSVYNLRGEIFEDLKAEGFMPVDAVGSENQATVDAVIRLLLEMV